MSNDKQHTPDEQFGEWLNHSWESWDTGSPSDAVWEELEASVVSETLWNRVNASLEAEEHSADKWIVASHENWEPANRTDVWERLNESISLEQVWQGLDHSLNRHAYRPSYWKLAVASVVALLISTHFTDSPVRGTSVPEQEWLTLSNTSSPASTTVVEKEATPSVQLNQELSNNGFIALTPVLQPQSPELTPSNPEIVPNRSLQAAQRSLLTTGRTDWSTLAVTPAEELLLPSLAFRTDVFPSTWNNLNAALAVHNTERPMPFNHWTVQVGAQLSILQERDQALLTSTLPRFGLAADMSYRHKVGPFQLIHSIGVSQYSQSSGKYVNGRHLITNQQVNAAQFHSTVGYTYKRFTVYGGFLVSKMLNGLEQNDNTVTKVYDFGRLQAGLTAGVDVRLLTFPRSGNQISFGSQYQWIPSAGGAKSSFENIQGLRFQTKFSF